MLAHHVLRGYIALSQKTVGMMLVWNIKRMELMAKENKYTLSPTTLPSLMVGWF